MKKKATASVNSPRPKTAPRIRPPRTIRSKGQIPLPAVPLWDDDRAFRILVKNSSDIFTFVDAQGKILYRSPSIRRIIHRPDGEVLRTNFLEWIEPDDLRDVRAIFDRCRKSPETPVPFQVRIRQPKGGPRWVEGNAINYLDNPSIGAILVNYHDVSERKRQEQQLLENERRYRDLFENSALAIFQSTFDGKVIRVNREFARMFGYASPEDAANSIRNVATDVYADPARRAEIIRLREKDPALQKFENLYRRKDGGTFWGLLSVRTVNDSEGRPDYFEGFIEDIAERKKAEQALRESAEKFRSIFDNSSAGVAIVGLKGEYRMVNPAFCHLVGYSEAELLQMGFFQITHPDDLEFSREAMQDVGEGKGRIIRFVKRYVHKDGHPVLADVSSALVYGADGTPSHFVTHVLDLTERRRVEEALWESEGKAGAIMASAPYGITFVNAAGVITYANPEAERILGLRRGESPNRRYDDSRWKIVAPDGRPLPPEGFPFAKVMATGRPVYGVEHWIEHEDGTRLLLAVNGAPLFKPDRSISGMVATFQDVTDRRRAEQAVRESEERYRSLFDNSLEGIGLSQGKRVIDANKSLLEIFGYDDLEEFRAVPLMDHVAPESKDAILRLMQNVTEGKLADQRFSYTIVRKDGSLRDLEISTSHVDLAGVTYTLSTFRDVTEKKKAEDELRALARRHEALLAAIPEIVMEVDNRKVYTWANPAGIEFFGEGVIGRAAADYFEGEQATYAQVQPLFDGYEGTVYVESWQRRKDGEKRLLAWWCRTLHDSRGEATGALSSARDITEQRMAEEQIQSLSRFPTENPNPVMRVESDGTLLYANAASRPFLTMWGIEVGRLVPEECRVLIGDVHASAVNREIEIAVAGRVFLCTLTPIPNAGYVNVYGRDVTERKQAEENLRESEEKYRTLIELSPDPIFIHTEGVVSFANSAGLALLGAESPGQILGKPVLDLIHPDYREIVARRFREGVKENRAIPLSEEKYLRLDGTIVDVEVMAKPIVLQGKVCAQIMMRDITERKQAQDRLARQAEELRQRNEELARLNEHSERQMRRMVAMRAIDVAITSSFKLELVLNILLGQLGDLLGADAADVLVYQPDLQTFRFASGRGFRGPVPQQTYLRKAESYANQAAQERRIVRVPRLEERDNVARMYPKIAGEGFTSYLCLPLLSKGYVKGVLEIFHRRELQLDPEEESFLEIVAGEAAIAIDNAELFDGLQSTNDELTLAYNDTLTGWARTLELRDRGTAGEAQRLADLTIRLAQTVGAEQNEMVLMYRGAILHDIGMMGIPDVILQKPGPLTEEEWAVVRRHPQMAYDLLSPINYLRSSLDIPFCHHEKWDGTGYPRGLREHQIPLPARIFAAVDVWDAMRSDRPYRRARTDAEARDYLQRESGRHFDPAVVQGLIELLHIR